MIEKTLLPTCCLASVTMGTSPRKQTGHGRATRTLPHCCLPETSHRRQQRLRAAARRRRRNDAAAPGLITVTGGARRTLSKEGHSRFSLLSQKKCEVTHMCIISSMLSTPTSKGLTGRTTQRETCSLRRSQGSRGML